MKVARCSWVLLVFCVSAMTPAKLASADTCATLGSVQERLVLLQVGIQAKLKLQQSMSGTMQMLMDILNIESSGYNVGVPDSSNTPLVEIVTLGPIDMKPEIIYNVDIAVEGNMPGETGTEVEKPEEDSGEEYSGEEYSGDEYSDEEYIDEEYIDEENSDEEYSDEEYSGVGLFSGNGLFSDDEDLSGSAEGSGYFPNDIPTTTKQAVTTNQAPATTERYFTNAPVTTERIALATTERIARATTERYFAATVPPPIEATTQESFYPTYPVATAVEEPSAVSTAGPILGTTEPEEEVIVIEEETNGAGSGTYADDDEEAATNMDSNYEYYDYYSY